MPSGTGAAHRFAGEAYGRVGVCDPAVQKRIAEVGQEVVPPADQTPQALAAHHKTEIEKWTPMIKAANIKTD